LGRKRELGNERLGEYVQRRSGGTLELRFPLPADVRAAFLNKGGQERGHIIRSLGTSDVRIANAKADILRASIRADIARIRQTRGSRTLEDFLVSLYDDELAQFRRHAVPIYKPFATQLVLRPHARLRQATLPRG
jgi:hypothetical protein